ncbi:MAG: four helix bundle protein [Symploca sp. SIO3C6]|nr:four helix bundle protein [Symploca sp. SIO3C6]
MGNSNITIQQRTENFAVRVINAYSELSKRHFDDAGKVLAKQFLRSGTSIGANCAEATYAQSKNDFISKYSIALKEASETQFWIKIMIKSQLVRAQKFSLMQQEIIEIIKILTSTINKLKSHKLITYYLLLITYYLT